MGESARTRLAVLVVLVVVAVPAVILFAAGGGEDEAKPRAAHAGGMRVERDSGGTGLTVYVVPSANVGERAGGRSQVVLRCVDADGELVTAQDEAWPFRQTDKGLFDPHAHLVLDPLGADSVERCLLDGTEPLLEAAVPR